MLMCKGIGCHWKKVCSRYVLGCGATQYEGCGDTWIDHCPHHQQKFIAVNSEEGRQVAELLNKKQDKPCRLQERLILDNRSSKPLYESYQQAYDFYFQEWSEDYRTQMMVCGDFRFYMVTNKDSVTIKIYDREL